MLNELFDALAGIVAVPWFGRWMAEHTHSERAVILAWIGYEFDRNTFLAQCAIHLLRLADRVSRIRLALQQEEWRLCVRSARERALPPCVVHVLPWLAEVPAVVPRAAFGSVFAELVNDRRAADDCFEAIGLAFDKAGHLAAVAIAHQGHASCVDWIVSENVGDAGQHVLIIASTEVVLVGCCELDAVVGRTARVGAENGPAVADEEVGEGIVMIFPGAEGTAVDVYDQRNFCGAGVGREVEQAFNGE